MVISSFECFGSSVQQLLTGIVLFDSGKFGLELFVVFLVSFWVFARDISQNLLAVGNLRIIPEHFIADVVKEESDGVNISNTKNDVADVHANLRGLIKVVTTVLVR